MGFHYASSTARKKDLILQAKRQPCVDCVSAGMTGIWPTESMQLDHLPGYTKRMFMANVGGGRNGHRSGRNEPPSYHRFSVAEVMQELSHCEPVCANHHQQRTRQRQRRGWQQENAGQMTLTSDFYVEDESPAELERSLAASHRVVVAPSQTWYAILLRHSPKIWD